MKDNVILDHIVFFTQSDPEEIVSQQKNLGHHAVRGGRHELWGTQNALLYTSNGYIEWLSVQNMDIALHTDQALTKQWLFDMEAGEGWGSICFSVDDIHQWNETMMQKGYKTSGVIHASRKTPAGVTKRWKMLFIDEPISEKLPLPFFIEWAQNSKERFASLKRDKTILSGNEKLKIQTCEFGVQSPAEEVQRWSEVLSKPAQPTDSIQVGDVLLRFVRSHHHPLQRLRHVELVSIR